MKNEMEISATYLFLVELCCFRVKCLEECWRDKAKENYPDGSVDESDKSQPLQCCWMLFADNSHQYVSAVQRDNAFVHDGWIHLTGAFTAPSSSQGDLFYLTACLSISLSLSLSISLSICLIYLSVYPSLFFSLFFSLSIPLDVYLLVYLFICLSIYCLTRIYRNGRLGVKHRYLLNIYCLSVYLCIVYLLFVYLSVYLLSVYLLYVYCLSIYLSVYLLVSFSCFYLFIYLLSVYLLSIYLLSTVYLSIS